MARTGDGAAQTSCVAVVQVVVRHGWPERYADGLGSMLEKPRPLIVTVAALETWMFTGAKEKTTIAVLQPPSATVNTTQHRATGLSRALHDESALATRARNTAKVGES